MRVRYTYLAILLAVIIVGTVGTYAYLLPILHPAHTTTQPSGSSPMTIIHIPMRSSIPPPTWHNFTDLSSPRFRFPVNITVLVGVNNTIEWINDDNIAHTVTSFDVPSGASTFNSDLIFQGKIFIVTLTTPGIYKYFCAWHNWLAGVITVKPA